MSSFVPISGLEFTSAGTSLFFTSPGDSVVVTSLRVVIPIGGAGADVTVYRLPTAGTPSDEHVVAAAAISVGSPLELRNLFLSDGWTVYVGSSAAGPVVSGDYSDA